MDRRDVHLPLHILDGLVGRASIEQEQAFLQLVVDLTNVAGKTLINFKGSFTQSLLNEAKPNCERLHDSSLENGNVKV